MTPEPALTPEQIRADLRLCGVTLRLDGPDLVIRGRATTPGDIELLRARKAELATYLGGPGALHRRDALDERSGTDLDDYGLRPPSSELAELRREYFSWSEERRQRFNRRADELQMIHHRAEAERLAAEERTENDKRHHRDA